MPPDFVMNHATLRERMDMAAFLDASARRGLTQVSVWGDEITKIGEARARRLLSDTGLTVLGYNRAGPFVQGDASPASLLDAARREIDRAAAFGADHILIFPGGLPPGSKDLTGAREAFAATLHQLGEYAAGSGLRLALEPLHPMTNGDRSVLVQMSEANALCDRLGAQFAIVIDSYHVWWDADLPGQIARAGAAGRICGFHVNDWLVPTTHLLRDRGMMGDGIIDLGGIWAQVLAAGYTGPIEIELFSDRWWAEEPEGVYDLCLNRCREIFTAP